MLLSERRSKLITNIHKDESGLKASLTPRSSRVSPIFKTALNNYRPIHVIPAVAKIVFENIFYDQQYNYVDVNDL